MHNHRNKYKSIRNKMNKSIRIFNKGLNKDPLFPNRFYIREVCYYCCPYEDGSGASMNVQYRVFDKLTGNHGDFVVDQYGFNWETWLYVNDFIIRSRDGQPGHIPPLHWYNLEIKEVRK